MHITDIFEYQAQFRFTLPLFTTPVAAGFPSPGDDFIDVKLDLNEYMVKHPAATFFVRVSGDSMTGSGIFDGDILVIDRSLEPRDGPIIIAALNGELTVKRIRLNVNSKYEYRNTKQYQNLNDLSVAKNNNEEPNNKTREQSKTIMLCSENPKYQPIIVTEDMEFSVWGVVTFVVHRPR